MKILVVEDEAIIAKDMENILNNCGCDVTGWASTAEESVRKAKVLQPDLVFMDIRLKGRMNGIEAAHKIHDELHIPVIYVTAFGDEEPPETTTQKNGFPRILKPFVEMEISSVIQKFLIQDNN